MFSFQKLLGKEDEFFTLLEASAEATRTSVQAAPQYLSGMDFSKQISLLEQATDRVVELVKALRKGMDLEKVIDRCRDAGNVIAHIVLKNS